VQLRVDLRGPKKGAAVWVNGANPSGLESIEPFPSALGARSMARGKRNCFVQEEQLRVEARRHDRALSPLEVQKTGNPTVATESADDLALVIMQRAAAVSH
jgi:hypothetical protein